MRKCKLHNYITFAIGGRFGRILTWILLCWYLDDDCLEDFFGWGSWVGCWVGSLVGWISWGDGG